MSNGIGKTTYISQCVISLVPILENVVFTILSKTNL